MKTLKTLLVLVALTFSTAVLASSNSEALKTDSDAITNQITKLLKSPKFILENEVSANVKITLNKNNEMVVLSVDSQEDFISDFIKDRINYSELTSPVNSVEKTFIVPVRVTPEE